jgi:hypothetical protein
VCTQALLLFATVYSSIVVFESKNKKKDVIKQTETVESNLVTFAMILISLLIA